MTPSPSLPRWTRHQAALWLSAALLTSHPSITAAAPPDEPAEPGEPPPAADGAPSDPVVQPAPVADEPAAEGAVTDAVAATEAILLPTRLRLTTTGETAPPKRRLRALRRRASGLDALLRDTAPDLGLVIDLTEPPIPEHQRDERELLELARERNKLVVLPIVEVGSTRQATGLRLVAAAPQSKVLYSRVQRVSPRDLPVRGVVMMRDVVAESRRQPPDSCAKQPVQALVKPAHSEGRAILAINGTLYGAFIGLSLLRSSGSDDPRLLYPLLAIGGGVGLGAAIIVADEWDVDPSDAWYLGAGAWWPAVAGHLIYEGRFGHTPNASSDEAWSFGLIASTTGLTLSTVGLLSRGMSSGGAVLAHSGGGVGMVVGSLAEIAVSGESDSVPYGGLGYGAAAGWLLASAAAVHWRPDPWRVLIVDLGLVLGGLVGASAASPLIFDEPTEGKTRGWVAAAGGGLLLGGGLAWYFTMADGEPSTEEPAAGRGEPVSRPQDLVYRWELPVPTITTSATAPRELHGFGGSEVTPAPRFGAQWHLRLW